MAKSVVSGGDRYFSAIVLASTRTARSSSRAGDGDAIGVGALGGFRPGARTAPSGTWRRSASTPACRPSPLPGSLMANSTRSPLPGTVSTFLRVLVDRQHLLQQHFQLHLAPGAARLHVGQHPLQVADADRQLLHLAQALVHLVEAVGHQLERFAQALSPASRAAFRRRSCASLPGAGRCRCCRSRIFASSVARTSAMRCAFDSVSAPSVCCKRVAEALERGRLLFARRPAPAG